MQAMPKIDWHLSNSSPSVTAYCKNYLYRSTFCFKKWMLQNNSQQILRVLNMQLVAIQNSNDFRTNTAADKNKVSVIRCLVIHQQMKMLHHSTATFLDGSTTQSTSCDQSNHNSLVTSPRMLITNQHCDKLKGYFLFSANFLFWREPPTYLNSPDLHTDSSPGQDNTQIQPTCSYSQFPKKRQSTIRPPTFVIFAEHMDLKI